MKLIPVILCGGAGSRLWPISRALHPKPFIRLENQLSLLQKTFLRGASLSGVEDMLIVTNRDYHLKIQEEIGVINSNAVNVNYLLEPCGRNTAAAIALATLHVLTMYGEEEVSILVLPADHLIEDAEAFQTAVSSAIDIAAQNKIVTFGIKATAPETGYGYIEYEHNNVIGFHEKPCHEKAVEFVASKKYLWNAGIFCFTTETLLRELKIHCPEILAAASSCYNKSTLIGKTVGFNESSFKEIPENSIDYALIEKSDKIAVVPCHFDWNDIGSWRAISEVADTDNLGNSIEGDVLLHQVENCYIKGHNRVVGVVGVKDLVIIDTEDALLVADKSQTQDVKSIYAKLKSTNHEAHKLHKTVSRPWGTYTILEEGTHFKIKRIVVKPGASLSLQMHHHRSEHWVVVSGEAKVTNGNQILVIKANESTFIPAGHKHRLENTTDEPIVLIEVQCGAYVGEDDIVRFEDVYGRVVEEA